MLINLAVAMKAKGLKHYVVAQAAGMTESGFSRALHGRGTFGPNEKKRIAEFLNADEGWLFATLARIPGPAPRKEQDPVPAHA